MAAYAGFTGPKGELLYEYCICQEGGNVTSFRAVTAKEAAGWLHDHEVALQLGKRKLAGEASTYAKRLAKAALAPRRGLLSWTWAT